jgi:hypothetical protein
MCTEDRIQDSPLVAEIRTRGLVDMNVGSQPLYWNDGYKPTNNLLQYTRNVCRTTLACNEAPEMGVQNYLHSNIRSILSLVNTIMKLSIS